MRRDRNGHPRPVTKIEVSENRFSLKVVLFLAFLVLGLGAVTVGLISLLSKDAGWQEVKITSLSKTRLGDEFTFYYDIGREGNSSAEYKALATLYTNACDKAGRLLDPHNAYEDCPNLCTLNRKVNEPVTVDESLYRVFEQLTKADNRLAYLAPAYDAYVSMGYCTEAVDAAAYDPFTNADAAARLKTVSAFARDPGAVNVELLGDNTLCLKVSEDYLAFARQEGVETYVDLGWMKNAFAIDMIAEVLEGGGYTAGNLTSADGFTRNLDAGDAPYTYAVYAKVGTTVYPAATLTYNGAGSFVNLRDYPVTEADADRFCTLLGEPIRTFFASPRDGLCRNATHDLLAADVTGGRGCAELALSVSSAWIGEELGPLPREITVIYPREHTLVMSGPEIPVEGLLKTEDWAFTLERAEP